MWIIQYLLTLLVADTSTYANGLTISSEAIREAAINGHLKMCKWLINRGVNINIYDTYALSQTIYRGHYDVCKLLINHGVSIDMNHIDNMLTNAISHGYYDICKLLIRYDVDLHGAFAFASKLGRVRICNMITQKK